MIRRNFISYVLGSIGTVPFYAEQTPEHPYLDKLKFYEEGIKFFKSTDEELKRYKLAALINDIWIDMPTITKIVRNENSITLVSARIEITQNCKVTKIKTITSDNKVFKVNNVSPICMLPGDWFDCSYNLRMD